MTFVPGRRPPCHHLRLCPGQRDVGEAHVLPGDLGQSLVFDLGTVGGSVAADMQATGSLVVVVAQHRVGLDVPVERERQVHHRELQSLAAPHRHDLHRGGVTVQSAVAFGRAAAVLQLAAQPITKGRQVVPLSVGGLVQQLTDVRQVGHVAFAAPVRQYPLGHSGRLGSFVHRRDAVLTRQAGPVPEVVVKRSVNASPPVANSSTRWPKNMVVAAARTTPLRFGVSNASNSRSQSCAAADPNTSVSPE